ncbi:MAG: helix-turn-helix domain-containing protein [Burkholderiaceae bacterium]
MTVASTEVSISAAPPWAARFSSDELDEIHGFIGGSDGEHSRVANARGPLGFELSWVSGAASKAGWGRMAIGQTIRGAVPAPTLHLAVPSGSRYRLGRREYAPSLGSAMFLAPGWEFTRTSPPGSAFGLNVSEQRLAREIEARRTVCRDESVFRTQVLDLEAAEQETLVSAALETVLTTRPESSPLAGQHAEARLTAVIADLIMRRGSVPRGHEVSSARLAGLESWIEDHLDVPLTIGRLCAVSGVGERCLQKEFHLRRGMSPMRFVTERRLAAARERLLRAGPRNDVTSVAVDLGFGHVGRFAQLYREVFGESPSETLKRGRAGQGVRQPAPVENRELCHLS